jgi:putative membrane protein|tara:strand:- start:713 stop:1123 length:411 start_codon:yes stop_codon:yes gene_type:complete
MDAVITSLYNGLPIFMLHGGTAILMLIVGAFIYSKITPWNELDLIMEGNTAAAVSFSGAILGIAIPLAAALSSSISIWEIVVWGSVAIILQITVFLILDLVLPNLSEQIKANKIAAGIFIASNKIALALMNAAAVI